MEEKENLQSKTLIVSSINHRALSFLKLEENFKSIDEVISKLIEEHNKLKVMGLANKEKQSKNGKRNN
jgi:hypothetical protein